MAARKESVDPLINIASQVGEMLGSNKAILVELGRINSELLLQRSEMNRKHDENQQTINEHHRENAALLEAHKTSDEANFAAVDIKLNEIFSWKKIALIIGSIFAGLITIAWAVIQVALPFLTQVRLGE